MPVIMLQNSVTWALTRQVVVLRTHLFRLGPWREHAPGQAGKRLRKERSIYLPDQFCDNRCMML